MAERLGLNINLQSGYKLCDFKPVFGYLWQSELDGYQYWGTCDVDLVLGNTKFFLEPLLDKGRFDVINFRTDYFAGSFFLLKNLPAINSLFKKSIGWEKILISEQHYAFDEVGHTWHIKPAGGKWSAYYEYPNFTSILHQAVQQDGVQLYKEKLIKEFIGSDEVLLYDGCSISSVNTKQAFLHYHFISEKKNTFLFRYPKWDQLPKAFYNTKAGFFDASKFTVEAVSEFTKQRILLNQLHQHSIGKMYRLYKKVRSQAYKFFSSGFSFI